MTHLSMFKKIGDTVVQVVTKPSQKETLESDGFVDHVEKVSENKTKRTPQKKAAK